MTPYYGKAKMKPDLSHANPKKSFDKISLLLD